MAHDKEFEDMMRRLVPDYVPHAPRDRSKQTVPPPKADPLGLAPAKPKEKESAPPPKKWKSPSQMKGTGKLGRYIPGIGQFRGVMNKGGMVGRRGKSRK